MTVPAGLTTRPLEEADAGAAADLMNTFEARYVGEPDIVTAADVKGWWVRMDLPTETLGFVDPRGRLVAFGMLEQRHDGIYDLDGFVHPDHVGRGLGGALIDWAEECGRSRGHHALRTAALAADPAAGPLIQARGFAPLRHFYRMIVDLDGPPPPPVWPEGVAVSAFRPGEEELLREVMEAAFADHWGYEPRDREHWQRTTFGQEWFDPSLVMLVRAGDEVVAAAINAVRFGMGFVDRLGTRRPWRGRGLGRALLLAAFGELYRRGERRVGLGVDAGNETGATQLYESVGMRIATQADLYEKLL